jgi:hypothetical protein
MAQLTRYIDASLPSNGDGLSWETAWNSFTACWGSCDTADDYTIYLRGGTDNVPPAGDTNYDDATGWTNTLSATFIGDWTSLDVFDQNCYRWRGDPDSTWAYSFFVIGQSGCAFTFKNFVVETYPTKPTANAQAVFKAYKGGALGQQVTLDGCAFIARGTLQGAAGGAFMAQVFANVVAQNCVFVARPTTLASNVTNVLINHEQGASIRIANCIADSVLDNGSPAVMSNFGAYSANRDRTTLQVTNCISVRRGDRDFAYINEVRNCAGGNEFFNCPNVSDNVTIANEADRLALFVDAANGNFSPANPGNGQGPFDLVDNGRDSSVETGVSTDYYGNDRNDPAAGAAWDIGPYEWGFDSPYPGLHEVTNIDNASDPNCIYNGQSPAIKIGDTFSYKQESEINGWGVAIDADGFPIIDAGGESGTDSFLFDIDRGAGFDDPSEWTFTIAGPGVPVPPHYTGKIGYLGRSAGFDASAGWSGVEDGTWSATGLPPDLAIDPGTGWVAGVFTEIGVFDSVVITFTPDADTPVSANPFIWEILKKPAGGRPPGSGRPTGLWIHRPKVHTRDIRRRGTRGRTPRRLR